MGINDRISNLIEFLKMNPNSFADSLGIKGTVIYNIVKGRRSKPSFDLLQKILVTYHVVNANWLLSGDGELLKAAKANRGKREQSIGARIDELLNQVAQADEVILSEVRELIGTLIQENSDQKEKIAALYKKQEEILNVIRIKLNLDF